MELNLLEVKKILNEGLKTGADFAELFVEDTKKSNYVLFNKRIHSISKVKTQGVGIRLIKNDSEIYGSIASFDTKEILKLTKKLASNFQGKQTFFVRNINKEEYTSIPSDVVSHDSWTTSEKLDYLKKAEKYIYDYSNEISNARLVLSETDSKIVIYNSQGRQINNEKISTRVAFVAIASNGSEFEDSSFSPGISGGLELLNSFDLKTECEKISKEAIELLHAPYCPSGEMTVILGNKFGGVLFHEACGHPLEACSIARKLSVFSNKLGEKIASDVVTAIDDGTIESKYGYISVDDEGNKPTRNVLIKNGILNNYMIDNLSSSMLIKQNQGVDKEKFAPTGACRRESYKYRPTTRMTNTFIDNGESTLDEMIKKTKKGLYCVSFAGGQVDPSTDKFNFTVSMAYLIENGEIKNLVKGAGLIGYGYEILNKIDMVGNDLELAPGVCGASSGSIPVTVGQPSLRISSITVAGEGN